MESDVRLKLNQPQKVDSNVCLIVGFLQVSNLATWRRPFNVRTCRMRVQQAVCAVIAAQRRQNQQLSSASSSPDTGVQGQQPATFEIFHSYSAPGWCAAEVSTQGCAPL